MQVESAQVERLAQSLTVITQGIFPLQIIVPGESAEVAPWLAIAPLLAVITQGIFLPLVIVPGESAAVALAPLLTVII